MKSGRGGKRKGAGRPKSEGVKRVKFTPSIKPSTLAWINAQPESQGKVIDKLVDEKKGEGWT